MFKFITGKPLWMNILAGLVLLALLLFLLLQSLDWITKHDESLSVPSVTGKTYAEAQKILEAKGFEVALQDSVYSDTAAPLTVTRQFPEADAQVKVNRLIYLTINRAVPPMIDMPSLEGLTYRSAIMTLKQHQLKLEDTVYQTYFAKDYVMEQRINGVRVKTGAKILMGSSVTLVLGSGQGDEEFAVPDLYGKTLAEARIYLESMALNIGQVYPPELQGTENAYVYKQEPDRLTPDFHVNKIRQGQSIDLWVQPDKPAIRSTDTVAPAQNP